MAECGLLKGCIFFNDKMADMPATANIFKTKYCKGDNSQCARYKVVQALGREKTPPDLFPNQLEKSEKIISEG